MKKREAEKNANMPQEKADKEKVEAQSDANNKASDAKVDAAKKQ
jgi:colicin import membrane protein